MKPLVALCLAVALLTVSSAPMRAQEPTFVQIEAVPTLNTARIRARAYANAFPNVNGFRMSSGWYAIALGPYSPAEARIEMSSLKRERLIPSDSYIAQPSAYRDQFWPAGADSLNDGPPTPEPEPAPPTVAAQPAPSEPEPPREETLREARQSESLLTLEERKALQEALEWEGFYKAGIDGAFGRGTRGAMAAWQRSEGFDPTGVLTTRQRAQLLDTYRSVFDDLGLASITDEDAGIEIVMPLGKVVYGRTEAPFIQYDSSDEDGFKVLLISQTGDEATLFGLYDIIQTLQIIPPEGERQRRRRDFTIEGRSDELSSFTFARLSGGAVKGYTLVWPTEKDPRVMERVLRTMRDSFRELPGVILPDTAMSGDGTDQRLDLLAGLEIRRPDRVRSGFFVDRAGAVLTSGEAVQSCARLTIGSDTEADIAARDDTLGLALLQPRSAMAPIGVAAFQTRLPRLKSEIVVAGFSYGAVMELPVLTFGALADIRGLQGETDVQRLDLTALPGDAGGPVLDQTGAVVGLLQPREEAGQRRLPDEVSFATSAATLKGFLETAGLIPVRAVATTALAPEDISRQAAEMTVQVSCWN